MISIILSVVIIITAPLMGAGSFVCVGPALSQATGPPDFGRRGNPAGDAIFRAPLGLL